MSMGAWIRRGAIAGAVLGSVGVLAVAQPPRGPEGGPPPFDPLREALDRDHDHRLDADEIKNAATALLALDGNSDGVIDEEEFRPPHPPGEHGPPGEGPPDRFGPPDGEGPPRGGPPGERGPGGPGRGRGGPGGPGNGPRGGPGGPPPGGPPEGGPGGGRGAGMGPPNAERFVDRAMAFDADNDGKLDRNELMKFAEEMGRQRGGPGGPGAGGPPGGGPPGGPEGRGGRRGPGGGGPGGAGPGGPPGGGGDARPERPRRPE